MHEVLQGPHFPSKRKASDDCKKLLDKMLTALEVRVSIQQIYEDDWFKKSTHYVKTNARKYSVQSAPANATPKERSLPKLSRISLNNA